MDGLTSSQLLDELVDAPGAGFGFLGGADPVEDGVPIRTGERLEHRLRRRIGSQSIRKVLWNLHAGLPGVGGLPSTVLLRLLHLGFP